ncbi:MAG: M15 family metallopeptidase [Bacillota bacterium]|nr:M15 family metallopeptidase [Bacillota bacterium]
MRKNTRDLGTHVRKAGHNAKNSIYYTEYHAKKQSNTLPLRIVLIIIPIIIVAVIVSGVIMIFRQVQTTTIATSNNTKNIQIVSSKDAGKLLTIVNQNHPINSGYIKNLVAIDGIKVDKLAVSDLQAMIDAAAKDGVKLTLVKGYVSKDEQNTLYNQALNNTMQSQGLSEVLAAAKVIKSVPQGGNCEFETGFLIQFDGNSSTFKQSKQYIWLENHAIRFGFVERYRSEKTEITNMNSNPTIFRYVGKDNAIKMMEYDMCLEEYVTFLNQQ